MTALPLSNNLAKVKALLPVKIASRRFGAGAIRLVDKNGAPFCVVTLDDQGTAMARALLIRDAMNQMKKDEA